MKGPVGWFPDPEGGDGLRYFDGEEWTQIAPPPSRTSTCSRRCRWWSTTPTPWERNRRTRVAFLVIVLLCFSPFLILMAVLIAVVLYAVSPWVFWMLVAVVVACGIAYGMTKSEVRAEKRQAAARREKEKLSVRAEVEDELFLKGDERGTHGRFPPPV